MRSGQRAVKRAAEGPAGNLARLAGDSGSIGVPVHERIRIANAS